MLRLCFFVSVIRLAAPADTDEYVHLAGRTGRVGQLGSGEVTSLLASEEEAAQLRGVVEGVLGRELKTVLAEELVGPEVPPLTL